MTHYEDISRHIAEKDLHISKETMTMFLPCKCCAYNKNRTKKCEVRKSWCYKGRLQWLNSEV